MKKMHDAPLPRAEVIKAVERQRPRRVPLIFAHWWGEGLHEQYGERLTALSRYPEDAAVIGIPKFDCSKMGLSWDIRRGGGHDNRAVIDDWEKLDEFIEKLPDPSRDPAFDELAKRADLARRQDLYLIVG